MNQVIMSNLIRKLSPVSKIVMAIGSEMDGYFIFYFVFCLNLINVFLTN